jgi:chromosome segregation ATPase
MTRHWFAQQRGFEMPPTFAAERPLNLDTSWPPRPDVPGDSDPEMTVQTLLGIKRPPKLSDHFAAIMQLVAKAAPENADLLTELDDLQHRLEDRLAHQAGSRLAALREEHAEARKRCRQALDHARDLKQTLGKSIATLNSRLETAGRERLEARSVHDQAPPEESYPTAAEVADWQARQCAANERLDAAEASVRSSQAEVRRLSSELDAANEQLGQLMAAEAELRARVEGRPFSNEMGLQVPAET